MVCSDDTECTVANEICHLGTCRLRCGLSGGVDCAALGETCNFTTGHCTGTLPLGADCVADGDCLTDHCFPFAVNGMSQRNCSLACSSTGMCPTQFQCVNVVGMSVCLHESLFNAQFRNPAGGACSRTVNTCQSGWCATTSGRCIEDCLKESDCAPHGAQCFTYIRSSTPTFSHDNICINIGTATIAIGGPCRTDPSCRSGVCDRDTGLCARHCCTAADCGANENCTVYPLAPTTPLKICKPRPMNAGPARIGDACNLPADCETGVCALSTAGQRLCSTYCCADVECNQALPGGGTCRAATGPLIPNTLIGQCRPR